MKAEPRATVAFDLHVLVTADAEPPADDFAQTARRLFTEALQRAAMQSELQRYPYTVEFAGELVLTGADDQPDQSKEQE